MEVKITNNPTPLFTNNWVRTLERLQERKKRKYETVERESSLVPIVPETAHEKDQKPTGVDLAAQVKRARCNQGRLGEMIIFKTKTSSRQENLLRREWKSY